LIPTPNVPYRGDITGMILMCTNPQGKVEYEKVWPLELRDIGDVSLPQEIPNNSILHYIDNKWVPRPFNQNIKETPTNPKDPKGAEPKLRPKKFQITPCPTLARATLDIKGAWRGIIRVILNREAQMWSLQLENTPSDNVFVTQLSGEWSQVSAGLRPSKVITCYSVQKKYFSTFHLAFMFN